MKDLNSIDNIFSKKIFRIPDYQRGYAWGKKQLIEFWEDLISLDSNRLHYTGVLSIKHVSPDVYSTWTDVKWLIGGRGYKPFYIVDGQQRITTVAIFIQCLVEAARASENNSGRSDDQIYLGSYKLSEIVENYILIQEPQHQITKSYKFGYEVDNPSFKFLKHHIFSEPNGGSIQETFYTLNLENAKKFFSENLNAYIRENGLNSLEDIFTKLTQKFLFNLYEIDDSFDVFVAFETMNNRGKRLSDLELLKNRLIYLTTLYPSNEVSPDVKETIRAKINSAWGEIYNQLGKNKIAPLNDDEFLRAHWIMYFKYSREKGDDYIRFLLNDYFSPKKVFEKIKISTTHIKDIEEVRDSLDAEDELENVDEVYEVKETSKLTIKEINNYVESIKTASKVWGATFFPQNSDELSSDEKLLIEKLNRLKVGYFRPLIMTCLLKTNSGDDIRLRLLKELERFIFLAFRVSRAQSNFGSSYYSRACRSVYFDEKNIESLINNLAGDLEWVFDEDGEFKLIFFQGFIEKKFAKGGLGFYGWSDLRYFLFEYEEHLKQSRNQPKLGWGNFTKHDKDKVSIEHIYPQTDSSKFWKARFGKHSEQKRNFLKGSLGNLLPLSSSINSSLQNDDFPDKKATKKNDSGETVRNGYSNGSYSELEVAACKDWTPEEILKRGLKLLEFMEKRWNIKIGDDAKKLNLLHLSFIKLKTKK